MLLERLVVFFFFFKQKTAYEIRTVTGVQTCALPICCGSRMNPVHGGLQLQDPAEAELIGAPGKLATQSRQRLSDFLSRLIRGQFQTRHEGLSPDRKSTRLNSSHRTISYAVFCLKKKI